MFEKLKEWAKKRVENNSVKIPDMSWTDAFGVVHTEIVYLKRSRMALVGDWARIYPPVNEDNSWNLINWIFGGKKNFIKLLIILAIIGMVVIGVKQIIQDYTVLRNIPCVDLCLKSLNQRVIPSLS